MEEAANRSAGKLNIAADSTATVAKVKELCSGIVQVADSLGQVEGVLNRAVALRNGENELDRLIGQIRRQALADMASYHGEIMEVLSHEVRRDTWAIHAYGMTGLVGLICTLLWLAVVHR